MHCKRYFKSSLGFEIKHSSTVWFPHIIKINNSPRGIPLAFFLKLSVEIRPAGQCGIKYLQCLGFFGCLNTAVQTHGQFPVYLPMCSVAIVSCVRMIVFY